MRLEFFPLERAVQRDGETVMAVDPYALYDQFNPTCEGLSHTRNLRSYQWHKVEQICFSVTPLRALSDCGHLCRFQLISSQIWLITQRFGIEFLLRELPLSVA